MAAPVKRCDCRCGYTCGRDCGLPIMECMKVHYVKDCDHVWDGPWEEVEEERGGSVTCSRCGALALYHDLWAGP